MFYAKQLSHKNETSTFFFRQHPSHWKCLFSFNVWAQHKLASTKKDVAYVHLKFVSKILKCTNGMASLYYHQPCTIAEQIQRKLWIHFEVYWIPNEVSVFSKKREANENGSWTKVLANSTVNNALFLWTCKWIYTRNWTKNAHSNKLIPSRRRNRPKWTQIHGAKMCCINRIVCHHFPAK